jgi:hypothetical protein
MTNIFFNAVIFLIDKPLLLKYFLHKKRISFLELLSGIEITQNFKKEESFQVKGEKCAS